MEESNIYYTPEKFGLEIVASIEADLSYEFEIVVVFKDKNNNLFWAKDSGCRCPIPFEDMTISDLIPLNINTLQKELMEDIYSIKPEQVNNFISNIRRIINELSIKNPTKR